MNFLEVVKYRLDYILDLLIPFIFHAVFSALSIFVDQYFSCFELLMIIQISTVLKSIMFSVMKRIWPIFLIYAFTGIIFYIFIMM